MFHSKILMLLSKSIRVYKGYCVPVCRKHRINQTAFDVLLFLANNPEYNSARDVCRIRGIESGIVSVTVESLIKSGYLTRMGDPSDRRVQRLTLTPEADPIVREGQIAQRNFSTDLVQGLTDQELAASAAILNRLLENIDCIEAGVKQND